MENFRRFTIILSQTSYSWPVWAWYAPFPYGTRWREHRRQPGDDGNVGALRTVLDTISTAVYGQATCAAVTT